MDYDPCTRLLNSTLPSCNTYATPPAFTRVPLPYSRYIKSNIWSHKEDESSNEKKYFLTRVSL